jgi:superfamily I DNA/RNA helicase
LDGPYLWQEVTRVIEGRGVSDAAGYLQLERHGRKRGIQPTTRALVWALYEEYRHSCDRQSPPLADPEWVLRVALDALRDQPTGRPYEAIIVDEAQDVTEVGLRFLLELLEGGPSGRLLLVGDQSQRIYAGGFRLSDAGVDVRGRSFALRECYRSTDEIMRVVASLGQQLSTDDFGEDGLRSLSTATVRRGLRPEMHRFRTTEDEVAWVVDQLRASDDLDSIAILVPTNARVDDWVGRLRTAGVASVRLSTYSGRPTPGVKLGTYARSKGLEFKKVFLPGLDDGRFPWGARADADSMILQGSMLYVAMSRARDELAISYAGTPSYFVEPLADLVDQHVS